MRLTPRRVDVFSNPHVSSRCVGDRPYASLAVRLPAYARNVPTLEEIVFQAGRDALAGQDSGVTGIRQRTGTLLAAHALVASFLGATTVKAKGLHGFSWAALVALLLGLVIAAVLLSNWDLRFAIDAPDFYTELYDEAVAEAETETLGWLVSAPYGYHNLRRANAKRVRIMGRLLTVLGILMVLQTLFWLVALR